ncbi:adenylate/guanylate cyclase domain-containing protein [Acidovorax sp. Root217]|uniref:adenylate/guanylate cyclase domain-containing protein n=1 Tax=Acidovorax sp. Root217 TaxID=1736492 RepID=UPI001F2F8A0F|nr:adenylate/guanylate cyclase domain-containing protein [Acidovorax sp. Root217]
MPSAPSHHSSTVLTRLRQRFGRRALYAVLCLMLCALALFEVTTWHKLDAIDNRVGDALLRWHADSRKPPDDIVVIDIDQFSLVDPQMLDVAGKWVWPRVIHAEMISALAAQQPRAIVVDLILTQPDRFRPENDAELAKALAFERAFIPMVLEEGTEQKAPLTMAPPAMGIRPLANANPDAAYGIEGPLSLPVEVWRTGYINFIKDRDGTGRRTEVGRETEGWWIPHIIGRVADALQLPQPKKPGFRLNWYGTDFTRISYAKAYLATQTGDRKLPFDARGKIIVIGATASGILDFVPTPMDAATPGPFVLATGLANLQNNEWLREAPDWVNPSLVLLLVCGLALAFVVRVSPTWVVVGYGALATAAIGGSVIALQQAHVYWMPVSSLVLGAVALLAFGLLSSRLEMGQRRHVQAMFSRFVDPRIVQDLSEAVAEAEVSASREITLLFSDIRGFTSLSEHRKPEEIVNILNRYFEMQVEVIFRYQGTLDKFIGDAIMAFWGAPIAQPNHAVLAVEAALGMADALQRFADDMAREDPTAKFDIGIGVHTGSAVVGFLGTSRRLDYTAIGDAVNLCSRIEGCTKGIARVLVSESTRAQCGETFVFIDRGDFEVKGRDQAVRLFEPQRRSSMGESAPAATPVLT